MRGVVRIIGGKWRSRHLKIPKTKDLRPTPDRVRETLFNWLTSKIEDAHCLDLFTGTGALGFEALSRGAASVVMVDQASEVVKLIQTELKEFAVENAVVYKAKLPKGLHPSAQTFDIVFIDPPYQANLLLPCCFFLEENGFLSPSAYIYLEADHLIKDNDLPPNWHMMKNQKAGQVFYHLVHREFHE